MKSNEYMIIGVLILYFICLPFVILLILYILKTQYIIPYNHMSPKHEQV